MPLEGKSSVAAKEEVKGQIGGGDFLSAIFVFFILTILLFLLYYTTLWLEPALQNVIGFNSIPQCGIAGTVQSSCFNETISPYNATSSILAIYPQFDQWIPWLFILVNLAIIASAILLFSNFLDYSIGFLIMMVTIFLSIVLTNQARNIFLNPIFANVITSFPHILGLWQYLPVYEIVFTCLYLVIIAAKARITGPAGYSGAGKAIL